MKNSLHAARFCVRFSKLIAASVAALSLVGITACGGGDEAAAQNEEVSVNIHDPEQPVSIDVATGGSFADIATNAPPDVEPSDDKGIVYKDKDTNNLTRADIDAAPAFDLDSFADSFDQIKASQPGLSTSSDEFAKAVIADLKKKTPSGKVAVTELAAPSPYSLFTGLTAAERELVLRNPLNARRSQTAAAEAVNATTSLFTGSAYLTRADAFRHAFWNWLMSRCCGVQWATAFASAHESGGSNNDDKRMDLNNNMIGRRLFLQSPNSSPAAAQEALLDYKLLWVNSKQKNVTVGVDYLVYLQPAQSVTVFDDGPVYDDIYTITIGGKVVGDTPAGGSSVFAFDQIASGSHPMDVYCKLDGTRGGCGFEIRTQGATTLPDGTKSTAQITIAESQKHTTSLKFPTIREAKQD